MCCFTHWSEFPLLEIWKKNSMSKSKWIAEHYKRRGNRMKNRLSNRHN